MQVAKVLLSSVPALILVACGGRAAAPVAAPASATRAVVIAPAAPATQQPAVAAAPTPVADATVQAVPTKRTNDGVLSTTVTLPGASAAAAAAIDPVSRRLTVGDQAVAVEVVEYYWTDDGSGASEPWPGGLTETHLTLAAVDLDPRTPGQQLHITQLSGDDEDPTTHHQLVALVGGKLTVVWSWVGSGYNETPVTFPGDGTIRHIENAWEACHRLYDLVKPDVADEEKWHRTRAPIGELVWKFDAAAGTVMPAPLRKTKLRTDDCNLSG